MDYAIFILLIFNLGAIAFQDFKDRKISILLFVPLTILSFIYPEDGMYSLWTQIGTNALLLLAIYLLTWTYFKIKGKSSGFIGTKIGWGDVLILVTIIPLFESIALIGVLESGALLGIIYYLILRPKNKEIPFAGIVASIAIVAVLLNEFTTLNFFTDEIFANLLY
ncbi:MAG: hypothetical protein JKY54_16040 [Flavobacteriales bacterium]|nr:hypothetical protein [Flavobacteriales bacterium]